MVPAAAHDPGSGAQLGGAGADAPGPLGAVGDPGEVHPPDQGKAGFQVDMAVHQAGQHGASSQFDDLGAFADPAGGVRRLADEDEGSGAHRQCLRDRPVRVAGVDAAPADDEVRRTPFRGASAG